MKKLIVFMFSIVLLGSCGNGNNNKISNVEKKIFQRIEVAGMGILKDLKIQSVKKVNDSTYEAIHTFNNPVMNKEVRITRNYFFNPGLDSILDAKDLKSEMKSQGEWVKMGF